jgi:serine/threonine protein phosphatase PrpC
MIQGTHLVCANVGDSRTIMCRLGQAIPLSVDHKPSRPDERDRIIASGGTISTVGVLRWDARFLSSLS